MNHVTHINHITQVSDAPFEMRRVQRHDPV